MHNKYYKIGDLGYKIALISDTHYNSNYNLEVFDKIVNNIKEHKPDFICIAGDIIDTSTDIDNDPEELKNFFINLSQICPVIFTLGNHDATDRRYNKQGNLDKVNTWFSDLQKHENIYYLYNKSLVRDNLCFTALNNSVDYYFKDEDPNLFVDEMNKNINLSKKYYNILLSHSPVNILRDETFKKAKDIDKVNLVLSGHMHNGLVFKIFDHKGTRGYVAPYTIGLKRFMIPKYARNFSTKNGINLIVSGGVIKLSSASTSFIHKLNFLYPIEIDYIEI